MVCITDQKYLLSSLLEYYFHPTGIVTWRGLSCKRILGLWHFNIRYEHIYVLLWLMNVRVGDVAHFFVEALRARRCCTLNSFPLLQGCNVLNSYSISLGPRVKMVWSQTAVSLWWTCNLRRLSSQATETFGLPLQHNLP